MVTDISDYSVYPMLSCPVTVSLLQIEQEVGKGKSVAFRKEMQSPPLDNNLLVEHVIAKVTRYIT